MSKKKYSGRALKRRKNLIRFFKHFFLTPILVCVLLSGVFAAVAIPLMSDFFSIGNMFLQNEEPNFSKSYENIFSPSDNSGETVDAKDVEYPSIDKQFGKLQINSCGVDAKLFFGDGLIPLRNGVGVYAGSFIPGYGKTVIVTGHNNTYFNGLKNIELGDKVKIQTSYGNYEYKVINTRIAFATDKTTYDLKADKENLIMYTCYPFDELGVTDKRFFVYGEKVSGPEITGIYE